MCGIVGFLTETPDTHNSLRSDFMEQMLYVDGLRGQDSTGMFSVRKDRKAYYIKDAVDARLFLQQASIKRAVEEMRHGRYLCVGHNRKATLGSRDLSNAHPFVAGNVCMVHNGTLHSYHTLPSHPDGNSDSARVCQALANTEPGALSLLETLRGDYAFVWYDGRDSKIYFATNGKRPLAFLRAGDHTFFASEGMMAKFILSRTLDLEAKQHLPRITHFKPFHLYSARVGQVVFDIQKYEQKATTTRTYPINGRGSTSAVSERPTYGHNPGIRRSHTALDSSSGRKTSTATSHTSQDRNLVPKKSVLEQMTFPNESPKVAKKRIARINQLLKTADIDLRVGDEVEIQREVATIYSHQTKLDDPQGKVTGFMEWVVDKQEIVFYATVHNCVYVDVFSDFVDTVVATLSGAHFDEDGDLHITAEYKSVGMHRKRVADDRDKKEWADWLHNYFDHSRWFYNEDDEPEHEWFESTCLLTTRELDILLEDKKCCMCNAPTSNIPRDETFFVNEDHVICKECNEVLDDHNEEPVIEETAKVSTVSLYDKNGKIVSTKPLSEAIKEVDANIVDAEFTEVGDAVKAAVDSANRGAVIAAQAAKRDEAIKIARAQALLNKMQADGLQRADKPRLRAANDGTVRDSNGNIVPFERPAENPQQAVTQPNPSPNLKPTTSKFNGQSAAGQRNDGTTRHSGILTLEGVKPLVPDSDG